MRFVVDQHRVEDLPRNTSLPRHCESLERGENLMKSYTQQACKAVPSLMQAYRIANGLAPSPKPPKVVKVANQPKPTNELRVRTPRQKKPPKAVFSSTRFVCVAANPVAQVWLCTKSRWEVNLGHDRSGKRKQADKLSHEPGEYAVLKGDEPVLDEQGGIRVFQLRSQADAMAETIFYDTPGEDRLSMDPEKPTTTVYQNMNYSVHFDPDFNGVTSPFNIFDTNNLKMVLRGRGRVLVFKNITSAITEADRRDRDIRGV